MQDYLMRALNDDIGDFQLINVIRIICGQQMLHNGAAGEDHHLAKKMRARQAAERKIEIVPEENEISEEDQLEEIYSSLIK